MSYATDGICHNAEPGTYGHECGKPAVWLGVSKGTGRESGFCDDCARHGAERHGFAQWRRIGALLDTLATQHGFTVRRHYGNWRTVYDASGDRIGLFDAREARRWLAASLAGVDL